MHEPDDGQPGAAGAVTQADADQCCAASEADDAAPTSGAYALSVAFDLVTLAEPVATPDRMSGLRAWRTVSPAVASHVPKHLLLSVLLV